MAKLQTTPPDPHLDRVCAKCGLTFGSHRADSFDTDACPGHESRMDWDNGPGTHFVDSGEVRQIDPGTPHRRLLEASE